MRVSPLFSHCRGADETRPKGRTAVEMECCRGQQRHKTREAAASWRGRELWIANAWNGNCNPLKSRSLGQDSVVVVVYRQKDVFFRLIWTELDSPTVWIVLHSVAFDNNAETSHFDLPISNCHGPFRPKVPDGARNTPKWKGEVVVDAILCSYRDLLRCLPFDDPSA